MQTIQDKQNTMTNERHPLDWKKYIFALIITTLIFGSALYINSRIDEHRTVDVESVRDQIALDLLSSETQFNLLRDTSCSNIASNALSEELNSLSRKLSYMEADGNADSNSELIYLKKYYSLLEIKDYLLMRELRTKCGLKPLSILYFYGKKTDCPECENTQTVLTRLRQTYPELRIYSFDTNLPLGALNTLTSMFGIEQNKLPALVINDKKYIGFKTVEEIKDILPELKKIDAAREAEEKASQASDKNENAQTSTKSSKSTKNATSTSTTGSTISR
jgi:glutaredoxin